LAACLAEETAAADRIRVLDEDRRQDHVIHGSWPDAHHFQEISASHLEAIRARRQTAAASLLAAESGSSEARGVVTAARAAAEAVEQLINERDAHNRAEADRQQQHAVDDIARSGRATRHRAGWD
jgi:hypothetical protein